MAQKTDIELSAEALQIRNETEIGANTALRVGDMLKDIVDSKTNNNDTRPYKIFSALLNQSGGNSAEQPTSGLLVVGVSYELTDMNGTDDFTNVGAPNNNNGTRFIATGTTPNVWNGSTLTTNLGAPITVILENTLGAMGWVYDGVGSYNIGGNEDLFVIDKTFIMVGNSGYNINGVTSYVHDGLNNIYVITYDTSFVSVDGLLKDSSFEIRVYN